MSSGVVRCAIRTCNRIIDECESKYMIHKREKADGKDGYACEKCKIKWNLAECKVCHEFHRNKKVVGHESVICYDCMWIAIRLYQPEQMAYFHEINDRKEANDFVDEDMQTYDLTDLEMARYDAYLNSFVELHTVIKRVNADDDKKDIYLRFSNITKDCANAYFIIDKLTEDQVSEILLKPMGDRQAFKALILAFDTANEDTSTVKEEDDF